MRDGLYVIYTSVFAFLGSLVLVVEWPFALMLGWYGRYYLPRKYFLLSLLGVAIGSLPFWTLAVIFCGGPVSLYVKLLLVFSAPICFLLGGLVKEIVTLSNRLVN